MSKFTDFVLGQTITPPVDNGNSISIKVYGLNLDTLPYNPETKEYKFKNTGITNLPFDPVVTPPSGISFG